VDNTWSDTGKMIFNNWLGTVDQITESRPQEALYNGVDHGRPAGARVLM
jgi:hypothetical protein